MPDLLRAILNWSTRESAIVAVVLFGSRARETKGHADTLSDIDLQVVTSQPRVFEERAWTRNLPGRVLRAYAVRPASSGVIKITAVFVSGEEVDVVVVPAMKMRAARAAVAFGLHRRMPVLSRQLNELAIIMRGSHRVLLGGRGWVRFYERVVAEVRGTRLDDREALALAEEFFCDWQWVHKKLKRGELIAAQRVLHRSLSEINFRLLHEIRLRVGETSFREARRVELLLPPILLEAISVDARLEADSLFAATDKAAASFRDLIRTLVDTKWRWPSE